MGGSNMFSLFLSKPRPHCCKHNELAFFSTVSLTLSHPATGDQILVACARNAALVELVKVRVGRALDWRPTCGHYTMFA